MKSLNSIFLFSLFFGVLVGLICFPISVAPVLAAPPDPCFGNGAPGCEAACQNNPEKLQATCCWLAPDGKYTCQTCEVNTETGEFENCYYEKTGELDDNVVINQPPSGVAPPPATESCPENTVVNENGLCTPMTQTPQEPSDNKDQVPKAQLLDELEIQKLQPSIEETR
jgi:hypothetical protein